MDMFVKLLKWIFRAWPALALLAIAGIHLFVVSYCPVDIVSINKTVSLFSQLIGGLLILYSIDSNIGIIKNKNLFSLFAEYLREFPLIKRNVIVSGACVAAGSASMTANASVSKTPQSVEEHLQYLQEQINDLKNKLNEESKSLREKINQQAQEMGAQIQETKTAVSKIESKVEKVSIGGIKVQLFGVLLMIYGTVSGYAA
ncbi:hypothetical protein ACFL0R_06985 [Pseudomonadota bacterium]